MTHHHPSFSRFKRWKGEADGKFHRDFLGVRTAPHFWRNIRAQPVSPINPNYPAVGEQYFEWVFTLDTVYAARVRESFTMMELGAGYGPWLLRAHHAFQQLSNKSVKLIGVEGDGNHFQWMCEHFVNNGLHPADHVLLNACASEKDGEMAFLVLDDASQCYGQRIHHPRGRPQKSEEVDIFKDSKGQRYRRVQAICLETLAAEDDRIDLLHMDVQGYEYLVISAGMETMNAKVARAIIGTHSEEIERNLRRLLRKHGWRNVYDYPRGSKEETEWGTIQFRDGCQAWINQVLELQAAQQ